MKKTIFYMFIALAAAAITGCAGFIITGGSVPGVITTVTIRTDGNLSTVRPGGSLRFIATGRDITWIVSSTIDGTGPVSPGTTINSNGVLNVAVNETHINIYVIVTSRESGQSQYKEIRVATVTGVTVSPSSQSTTTGRTLQFSASVTGTNNPDNAVTWRVSSNAAGTGGVTAGTSINANGLLTIAANETLTALYVIAASVVDPSRSGSASVSVIIPIVTGVAVSPSNQSVERGRTLQFTASVAGVNNPSSAVTWRVSSNAAGTGSVTAGTNINANGLLTIAANETSATLFVIAISAVDSTKTGSAIVNIIIPIVTSVVVSPSSQTVTAGTTLQFSASVAGANNPSSAVTWRVSSNAAGTGAVTAGTSISANGLLTVAANETSATLFVIATSSVDTTKSGSAVVTVNRSASQNQQGQNQQGQGQGQNQQGQNQNQQGQGQNQQGQNTRPNQNQPAVPTVTSVVVSPSSQTVTAGASIQFSASVTGANNPSSAVTWRVSSNAAGTGAVTAGTSISANGLLTVAANETSATLFVIATSSVDTTKSGSAVVTVNRSASQNQQGQNQQGQGQGQNQQGQNQNQQGQNQNQQR